MLREGRESRHALARRLRLLALEVFFLGTAMGEQTLSDGGPSPCLDGPDPATLRQVLPPKGVQGGPTRIGRGRRAAAWPDIEVRSAGRAQAGAVGSTERRLWEVEKHGISSQGLQVKHVACNGIGLFFVLWRRVRPVMPLVELVHVDRQLAVHLAEASPTLSHPRGAHFPDDSDPPVGWLQKDLNINHAARRDAATGDLKATD
jgi:hypothetical protein